MNIFTVPHVHFNIDPLFFPDQIFINCFANRSSTYPQMFDMHWNCEESKSEIIMDTIEDLQNEINFPYLSKIKFT